MIDKRCREHLLDNSHRSVQFSYYTTGLCFIPDQSGDICGTGVFSAKPIYPPIKPLNIAIPPINLAMLPLIIHKRFKIKLKLSVVLFLWSTGVYNKCTKKARTHKGLRVRTFA